MQYDFKKAKKYIQMHSDLIEEASLGMAEDWFWTAEVVYSDNHFLHDLDTVEEIAGISGSTWATPSLLVRFKDGHEEMIKVGIGKNTKEKPEWFELGVLSEPCQQYINNISSPRIGKE